MCAHMHKLTFSCFCYLLCKPWHININLSASVIILRTEGWPRCSVPFRVRGTVLIQLYTIHGNWSNVLNDYCTVLYVCVLITSQHVRLLISQ